MKTPDEIRARIEVLNKMMANDRASKTGRVLWSISAEALQWALDEQVFDNGLMNDLDQQAAKPVKLTWTLAKNTTELTVWKAGDYEAHGVGRAYGGGIRRDWVLKYKGQRISGGGSRLSEAKRSAQQHAEEHGTHVPVAGRRASGDRTALPNVVGGR